MSLETLGQMLSQDPQICRRRNDLKEQLRRNEFSNAETDELSHSSYSASNRVSSLSSSGTDSDLRRPAESIFSGSEKRKTENVSVHRENPPKVQDLPMLNSADSATNRDTTNNRPGSLAPDLNSVAVFTHQVQWKACLNDYQSPYFHELHNL
jgi:hypothetical protein